MKFAAIFAAAAFALPSQPAAFQFPEHGGEMAWREAADLVRAATPRHGGTAESARAAAWICDRCGAPARIDRFKAPVPGGEAEFSNVVAEFPGYDPQAGLVVLVSHFDTAPGIGGTFQGANDGASTSGLLLAFARILKASSAKLRHPVALVWTDGEEKRISYGPADGLQGSKRAAKLLAASGRKVSAVFCLDMLGDRDLSIAVPANGDAGLAALAEESAAAIGEKGLVRRSGTLIIDDHVPFADAGFPAIDLIDFEYGSAPGRNDFWHSPADTLERISPRSLGRAGRLVAEMVRRVDSR